MMLFDFNEADPQRIPGQERDEDRGPQDDGAAIDFNDAGPQWVPGLASEALGDDGDHPLPAVIEPAVPDHFEPVAHAERMQQPAKRKKKEVPADRPDYLKGPGAVRAANEVDLAGCLANVQLVLERDAHLRDRLTHNVFADRVECWDLPWDDTDERLECREWTSNDTTELTIHVQRLRIPASSGICKEAVPSVARKYPSNPPFDYLAGLTWDGTPRLITGAQRYLGADADHVTAAMFRCWMISGVARIDRPGCKVDHALVLEGPQGKRKSAALRAFMPVESWFTDDLGAAIKNKDAQHAMRGKWIIELPEMSALKGVTNEEFKAWIVRQVDRYRPPYGHAPADFPRANIFAGTSNEGEYLEDSTGARRFWPIRCTKIDIAAIERDRDQLWAEAVDLYKKGVQWWLTEALEGQAREVQHVRTSRDPWADRVEAWLEEQRRLLLEEFDPGRRGIVTIGAILDALGIVTHMQNAQVTKRLSSILQAAGWWRYQTPPTAPVYGKEGRTWIYLPETTTKEDWQNWNGRR